MRWPSGDPFALMLLIKQWSGIRYRVILSRVVSPRFIRDAGHDLAREVDHPKVDVYRGRGDTFHKDAREAVPFLCVPAAGDAGVADGDVQQPEGADLGDERAEDEEKPCRSWVEEIHEIGLPKGSA